MIRKFFPRAGGQFFFLSLSLSVALLLFATGAPAQVSISRTGDEPEMRIDPRALDNGGNIRRAPGSPEADTFYAQLWLVGDRSFFAEAAKGPLPAFVPVRVAPRGRAFFAAILFGHAASGTPDPRGAPSVSYDVTVRQPDGVVYSESKGLIGAASTAAVSAAESSALRVGRDYLGIVIEPSDPAGTYTVTAVVRDQVAGAELTLKTEFVVETPPAAATPKPAP